MKPNMQLPSVAELRAAAALAEARELIDALGQDHPKAMLAMIRAIDLADPSYMDKALAECGITLPSPTHVDENGTPLLSSADLAVAIGVSHEEVVENIESLSAQGGISIPTKVSRLQ